MQKLITAMTELKNTTATFAASRYRFTLRAKEDLYLPEYKGFALRGGFGHAFRQAVCATRGECASCLLRDVCLYPKLFEQAEQQQAGKQLARPFLFEPPLDARRTYAAGETLEFAVVLFGSGQTYLPHFLLAFQALGEMGMGSNRARFELVQVDEEAFNSERRPIYKAPDSRLARCERQVTWGDIWEKTDSLADRIRLRFLTPTRLRAESRLQRQIDAELVIRAALRRFVQLAMDCSEADLSEVDLSAIVAAAKECELIEPDLHWYEVERYSSRQRQRMSMDGLVGNAVLQGDLVPVLAPLLVWCELTHVGKNAVFGLGQVEVSRA